MCWVHNEICGVGVRILVNMKLPCKAVLRLLAGFFTYAHSSAHHCFCDWVYKMGWVYHVLCVCVCVSKLSPSKAKKCTR